MALPFVYIAIMTAGIFLAIGLIYKDHMLITIASFFVMIIGIYTFVNGVDTINNYVSNALSISFIAVGGYFAVSKGMEFINDYLG